MTRHLQPPPHPVTGHPPVDNRIRNAWRQYRNYLNHPDRAPLAYQHTGYPRKEKKARKLQGFNNLFTYKPTTHYTPRNTL